MGKGGQGLQRAHRLIRILYDYKHGPEYQKIIDRTDQDALYMSSDEYAKSLHFAL